MNVQVTSDYFLSLGKSSDGGESAFSPATKKRGLQVSNTLSLTPSLKMSQVTERQVTFILETRALPALNGCLRETWVVRKIGNYFWITHLNSDFYRNKHHARQHFCCCCCSCIFAQQAWSDSNHEEASVRPTLRDILQNNQPALFTDVKCCESEGQRELVSWSRVNRHRDEMEGPGPENKTGIGSSW